ncbi:MAG TPA: glycosyltransferase [Blastocatellia bacterium]|nr:glycosyltransferase [Blastocatellia bacterium]
MNDNEVIQGLWIGPELSALERMSISSFLSNGHEYHLYVYDHVRHVPRGARVRDGNEILPSSMIFMYRDFESYSGFSNFFRYKLLLDRGGWWADTDTVCLKPFDFREEYVFSSEVIGENRYINSGVIKAPAGSEAMSYAWEVCRSRDPEQLVWGETGPRLMSETVRKFSLDRYAMPHSVFCPISLPDWEKVLDPERVWAFDDSTRAIHMWNEAWRRTGRDKNARYHPDCLYERLRETYPDQ